MNVFLPSICPLAFHSPRSRHQSGSVVAGALATGFLERSTSLRFFFDVDTIGFGGLAIPLVEPLAPPFFRFFFDSLATCTWDGPLVASERKYSYMITALSAGLGGSAGVGTE
jgi:hypothetical protein